VNNIEKSINVLGHIITPEVVCEVIQKAIDINWGTHLLRWRYFDVTHAGIIYHRNSLIPTALWHLLKRIYIDEDWPVDTTIEKLSNDAKATILGSMTEIYVYGYYRTAPPRLQWGFFNPTTRIAVVYDAEANLIATVFKPTEGGLFFQSQLSSVQINREEWQV